jgi:hypothetical protein
MKWLRCCALSPLFLVLGCGGTKPPQSPTGSVVTPPISSASSEAPDLSPVAAPPDLFAVGRLKNAADVTDTIAAWAKLPVDWRTLLKREAPGVQSVVMFDAPVNFAAALDSTGAGSFPQPFAVFSIGLSSLDGALRFARHEGESVHEVRAGVYRLEDGSMHCALAAAIGRAPARLVCGDRAEDVEALLPYVTRGLPKEALSDADFHAELRLEPFRRHYARQLEQVKTLGVPFVLKELSLDSPDFDRALADAVHGIGDEVTDLVNDVDSIDFDMTIAKGRGIVDGTAHVKFIGESSWSVNTLLDAGRRSAPAPAMFWQLPRNATSASFSIGSNPDRLKGIRLTLGELAAGFLEHEKVPRASRQRVVDSIEQLLNMGGPDVYARGVVPSELKDSAKASFAERKRDRIRTSLGWYVMGSDLKPATFKKVLNNWASVYRDPQLRRALEHHLNIQSRDLPALRTIGAGLGAGSFAYELDIPAKLLTRHAFEHLMTDAMSGAAGHNGKARHKKRARPAGKPLSVYLIVMPAKDGTWLGFSADEKKLKSELAILRKPSADNTLASREGLSELKNVKLVSGGFASLEGLVDGMRPTFASMGHGSRIDHLLDAMPHHGVTPMLVEITASDAGKPNFDWSFRMPKASVEDIGSLVPGVAAMVPH